MSIPNTPKYLPRWMDPVTLPPSGTLLGTFWEQGMAFPLTDAENSVRHWNAQLRYFDWDTPRLAWSAAIAIGDQQATAISARLGAQTVPCRAARSAYDFQSAYDPVWIQRDTGSIEIRNLERIVETTSADSSGNWSLGALVADADIGILQANHWSSYPLDTDLWNTNTGLIPYLADDPTTISYASAARAAAWSASGMVFLNTNPTLPLFPLDLTNSWDDVGGNLGLSRFPGEDNVAYAARLADSYTQIARTDRDGVCHGVARRTDRVEQIVWDSSSPLTWAATEEVTAIFAPQLAELETRIETIAAEGNGTFTLGAVPLPYSVTVFRDSTLQRTQSASGRVLIIPGIQTGTIVVRYRVANYTLTRDSKGYIRSIVLTSDSAIRQAVTLCLTRATRGACAAAFPFGLKRPDGSAAPELTALADRLEDAVPITLNHLRWGLGTWIDTTLRHPQIGALPQNLDDY